MCGSIMKPHVDLATLLLRFGLAAIFVVHGYIKIGVGFPIVPELTLDQQVMVGWAELICGGMLAIGLMSRLAALVMLLIQAGAIAVVTGGEALSGLGVTRVGANYSRVGPEYNLVLISMCLAVILLGSGFASADRLIFGRYARKSADSPAVV